MNMDQMIIFLAQAIIIGIELVALILLVCIAAHAIIWFVRGY